MEYDQRYNQALGYMLDLYTDNSIGDSITAEQFKELFDMFIDSRKDIDNILYSNDVTELEQGITIRTNTSSVDEIAKEVCNRISTCINQI